MSQPNPTGPIPKPSLSRLTTDAALAGAHPAPVPPTQTASGLPVLPSSPKSPTLASPPSLPASLLSNAAAFLPPPLFRQGTTNDAHGSVVAAAALPPFEPTADSRLTANQLHSMARVSPPVVSPSGMFAVFTVKQLSSGADTLFDDTTNAAFTTSLYLLKTDLLNGPALPTGVPSLPAAKRLTNAKNKTDMHPLWLDDENIVFLSTRSGKVQAWVININGGEPVQLTDYPVSIGDIRYNAAQKYLVFVAEVYPETTAAPQTAEKALADTVSRDEAKKSAKTNFMVYDKLFMRRWDKWLDGKRNHLFLQPLNVTQDETGAAVYRVAPAHTLQDLMAGLDADCPLPPFGGDEQFSIAPDGLEITYATQLVTDSTVAWSTNVDIYSIRLSASAPAAVGVAGPRYTVSPAVCHTTGTVGNDHDPAHSPDGKWIAYLSMERAQFESDKNRIMLINRAEKTTQQLAASWNLSVQSYVWAPDSSALYLISECKARVHVFRLAINDPKAEPVLVLTAHSVVAFTFVGANHYLFANHSFNFPTELYAGVLGSVSNLAEPTKQQGPAPRQITFFNRARLSGLHMSEAEDIYFKGAHNEDVQMWLFKPSNYEAGERTYPLAVVIHGGPQGAINDGWHYRWNPQVLATHGYAVLCINFHGSTGFGQKFTDSISGDWGGAPFQDIMAGVDHILQRCKWIDPARMAALGASYGGYMINYINGHTDRFRCLVNHDGILNQTSMYYETEELYFPEFENKGLPWNSQLYEKFSPHNFVDKWKTPTLVIHGGKDYRVLESQGIATFTALQRRGIESRFLYFPEENHWVLSPANSIVWHRNVIEWVNKFTFTTLVEREKEKEKTRVGGLAAV